MTCSADGKEGTDTNEPALLRLERLIDWVIGEPRIDYLWRVAIAFAHETYEPRLASASAEASRRWSDLVGATIQEAMEREDLPGDPQDLTCELTTVMNGALFGLHSTPPRLSRSHALRVCKAVLHRGGEVAPPRPGPTGAADAVREAV